MDKTRYYHKIVEEILDLVETGVFPTGSRLPSERELALKFGVSRACIREALIVLEAQGCLKVKARSGAYIFNAPDAHLNNILNVESFELTEACSLFEAEVAALAASLITDETILELEKLARIIGGQVKSDMTPDEADAAFHKLIASATNNRVIIFVIGNMWKKKTEAMRLQTTYSKTYKACSKELSPFTGEHSAILEALKDRNPDKARKATQNHFIHIMKALLEASEIKAYREMQRKTSETRSRFLLSSQLN